EREEHEELHLARGQQGVGRGDRRGQADDDTREDDQRDPVADALLGDLLADPHDERGAGGQRHPRQQAEAPPRIGHNRSAPRTAHALEADGDTERLHAREHDGAVARVLRDLLPPGLAFLGQPLQRGDHDRQQLQDDGRRDVRHDAEREDRQSSQVATREKIDHAQQRALDLIEELRERVAVDARGGDVGTQTVRDQQHRGEHQTALELRDLEDVLEALEAFDHVALTSAASSSTRPPLASIFWRADALMACTLTVRAWGTSPSPRIFTRSRSEFLMSRALTRPSASTTEFASNAVRDLRLTTAYGCLPP